MALSKVAVFMLWVSGSYMSRGEQNTGQVPVPRIVLQAKEIILLFPCGGILLLKHSLKNNAGKAYGAAWTKPGIWSLHITWFSSSESLTPTCSFSFTWCHLTGRM